jgi:hypothetical protein
VPHFRDDDGRAAGTAGVAAGEPMHACRDGGDRVYWKPVWNILSDGDFELIVANAAHIKNVPGRKTDPTMRCGSPIWLPAV